MKERKTGGQPVVNGIEPARSDQANVSPVLEGKGSIPGWGGDFSPLILCGTDFQTGCRVFSPGTPVSSPLP